MKNSIIKINLTFWGIILFFFLFSLFILNRMAMLNEKSTEMETNWLPSIIAINAINTATSDYRIAEALHVLAADNSKMEQQERYMERLRQQIANWQTRYEPLISSEEETAIYHKFKQQYEEYLAISKEAIVSSRRHETDTTVVKLENSGILFNAFSNNLNKLVQLNSEGGIQSSRGGDQIFKESKITIFGVDILVLIAGFILILLMKGWMSPPIKLELTETTKSAKANFFNTLTVKTKLRFAFLGLAILFVVFAVLALEKMQIINDKSTEIASNWLPSVELVNAINTATSDLRTAEALHILSSDPIEMTQREKDIEKLKQEINNQRKTYERLISSANEHRIYEEFARKYDEYLAAGKKAMIDSSKNEDELAAQQLKNSGVIFEDMSAELMKLVAINNQGGQQASQEGDRLYSVSMTILISAAGLVFMLAIFALVVFEKLTSQPLTQLSGLIQQLAAGDISISPILQNRYDEVGHIAQAVAAIAQTLKALVSDSINLISAVQAGTLSIQVDSSRHPGEFGTVVAGMNQLVSVLSKPLVEVAEVMKRLALGDLKGRMQDAYEGDLQTLKNNVNNSLSVSSESLVEVSEVMQGLAIGNLKGRMQGNYEGELKRLKTNVNNSLDILIGLISELSQTITYMTESNWEAIKNITHDSANSTKYQGEFIQIKKALEAAAIKLAETATKNETQDWLKSGQAQLNNLMGGNQEIAVLAKKIITFLTTYIQAQVGIFYLLRDSQSEHKPPYLQIIASYAYTTPADRPNQFLLTESLIGQAALDRKTITVTQTTEECPRIIRSSLSGALPHHILLIPFLYETTVKGVIEIGMAGLPTTIQREFLEQVMSSIGITINTAESRAQMQTLLRQTQIQAEQLQHQQEELQQSNEELRMQQEQLETQTVELEERTEELEQQKTEMEQKNLALEQTQQTLSAKARELELAIQYKSEFLANTSHELRTPLNGIIGLAESLIDGVAGELSDQAKANLAMIVGSGKRLATLVNDILDFSKLQHQDIELQLQPIGLREITEIILTLSQPLVLNKPVQLLNTISTDLPPALADENRLQQILYNLIGNAIKFTESGTVKVSAKVIDEQHLELVVADTGIGIAEDKLERIFESFEQAEGSTAREYGGTGLGLAVTKQLVQLHGGKIWVKSIRGQGSQFYFTLPIAKGQSSQLSTARLPLAKVHTLPPVKEITPVTQTTPAQAGEVTAEDRLKILIVDDEPVNLQVLNNYLSLQNYHIVQATSGVQALAFIEEGFKPDAILLDVMMPKMTGYEVTQKLREQWQADELPILLLTAKNQVTDLVTGLESGANDYLTKPISKDELLARLKTHLQLKELKEETLQLALENERMKTELEVTRRLQQLILPKEPELDNLPHLEIAGFMEAADEVGGDYYDVLQQNDRLLIGIGDVTGHGLESGMLMLMAQAGIRTLWEHEETDVVKFFNSLNRMIYKNAQERLEVDKNLTLSLLEYQPTPTGGVLRISGRHEDILIVRAGQLERINTGDLGFQVGFVDDIAELVKQIEVPLTAGDVVVLYTDGITEAENPQRQEYGIKRLSEVVVQNWQRPVKEIRQAVIADVRQHIGQQKVFDDMTLVVLKQTKTT
jgi:signal transduction histidine kinase/serine phosphatase RsbU (regulator of sigma subunit)/HAMP domain-containing protein